MPAAVVRHLELRRVALRLRQPVRTAYGVEHDREIALVRVVTDEGEGWGECAALPEPTYHPEYVAGALHVLEHHLGPRLVGTAVDRADAAMAAVVGHHMAKAAVEMALLDARLHAAGRSLATELGATADAVAAGRTIGLADDLGAACSEAIAAGYRHLKLKITPASDLSSLRSLPAGVTVSVDANGSFDPERDAAALDALDALGLASIEQPLAVERLDDHAALAARLRTPVTLDEDVVSVAAGVDAVRRGAAAAVAVKPGRLGGLRRALALGRAVGGRAWIGGMYEAGVGRAAILALAACTDAFALPVDWSASDRYWDEDLTAPHVLRTDGTIAVPTGPGLGVSPDPSVLARVTVDRRSIGPS